MIRAIECEGAPRDLGLDQGRACREALAQAFAALPAPRRRERREAGAQGCRAGAALVAAEVARRALAGERGDQAPRGPGPRSASLSDPVR